MKKMNLTIRMILLVCGFAYAQSPERLSYQSIVRDGKNELVRDQPVGLRISLIQGSTEGKIVYMEEYQVKSNGNGLITIEIGGGEAGTGDWATVDWGNGPYFIKTETDPDGGTAYAITGMSQLLSVPYALHAKTAERLSADRNSIELKNLSAPVDARDAATKEYVDALETLVSKLKTTMSDMEEMLVPLLLREGLYTVEDIDGNIYPVVQIGDQVWMAANLRTTRYNDGTSIPLVTEASVWETLTTPAYCWYNNNSAAYADPYGVLYNWYTVNTKKICPAGWHVPSNIEWDALTAYVGRDGAAKLKVTGVWDSDATNTSGFSAYPAGVRSMGNAGEYEFFGNKLLTAWWLSNVVGSDLSVRSIMFANYSMTYVGYSSDPKTGLSVRCLKD